MDVVLALERKISIRTNREDLISRGILVESPIPSPNTPASNCPGNQKHIATIMGNMVS